MSSCIICLFSFFLPSLLPFFLVCVCGGGVELIFVLNSLFVTWKSTQGRSSSTADSSASVCMLRAQVYATVPSSSSFIPSAQELGVLLCQDSKISFRTQDKQLWASIKKIPIQKMENGSRARNNQTKARLKPSRKTLPITYVQHHTRALRDVRSPASMALLLAVHTASLLGWYHLWHEACIRRFIFQHLECLENSTAV